MTELKHEYIRVEYGQGVSYGGNQRLSGDPVIRKCGCGIVSAVDTLLYMSLIYEWKDLPELQFCSGGNSISADAYNSFLIGMKKTYFPVLYPLGTGGLAVAAGMNMFFKRGLLPFRAAWHTVLRHPWEPMEIMLNSDIPVICAVGQNFPRFWEKNGLSLHISSDSRQTIPSALAKAHFVTVTGMDTDWIQLSSWGRKYYFKRKDYEHYAVKTSNPLLCGMLYIEHK